MNIENRIKKENNLLLLSDVKEESIHDEIMLKFCGRVVTNSDILELNSNMFVYLCGNIQKLAKLIEEIRVNYENLKVYIIKEYSYPYNQLEIDYNEISLGEVPLNYYDVGIYFRNFFGNNNLLFDKIEQEHDFQELTESNKPNKALRTGLYMTHITEDEHSQLHFNLLRCSSNFAGSTDNFRETDLFILDKLNRKCNEFFEQSVNLNHVLAQIYHNKISENKKATIKEHSDKTKDMPRNGLIAFCTFYKNIEQQPFITKSKANSFDYCYKEISVLTRLYFKLKPMVEQNYVKEFYVTLYPNSVFLIPLSTNRMYTHEIRPSYAPIDYLPIRMGYVVRCSNQRAIYSNGLTYVIDQNQNRIELEKPDEEAIKKIRGLYLEENTQIFHPDYNEIKHFSMNDGDFEMPLK